MEIFKVIKEYPAYSISDKGRVMKNSTHKIMKPSPKPNGYMQINLFTNDGRRKKEYIHRLVAITFIPNEQHLPQVNHIDGVRDNNVVSNLEWVTAKGNILKSSVCSPIRVRDKVSFEEVGVYTTIRDACKELGLTESNVAACLGNSRQKTHRGYVFEPLKTKQEVTNNGKQSL